MTNREQLLSNYQMNEQQALELLKSQGYYYLDKSLIWQILIYELEHYNDASGVLYHNLTTDDIISHILSYFSENGPLVEEIELEKSIIPDDIDDSFTKGEIKFGGEVWKIHKNDKDTFPSQPHAHNYDRQYKMHLGNGQLYRKKKNVGGIRIKDLITFRELIRERMPDTKLPKMRK